LAAAVAWGLLSGGPAQAQQPPAAPAAPAANAANKPVDVTFKTGDGVNIVATYYPSSNGKDAVPVILVHGFKGNRGEFKELALYLQGRGCAVLAPDLRGHGDSTKKEGNNRPLNPDMFKPDQFEMMYKADGDLEKCKSFLLDKNNQGDLNIDKLCVIGAQLGANLALNWAVTDWSWPVLLNGKQGQDVKALVLISPEVVSSRGQMSAKTAALNANVGTQLSIMILVGQRNTKAYSAAQRIYKFFEKNHPAPPPAKAQTDQDLFFIPIDADLQGTKLLAQPLLKLNYLIGQFIEWRLIKKSFPWRNRKS